MLIDTYILQLPEIETFVRYKQRETLETLFCEMIIIITSKNNTAMSTLILVQW